VELEDGKQEILCTSLVDAKRYPREEFKGLYHFRWGIEESYKMLKCRVEVENFSGKTATAVKQDFYAKMFLMSLCAIYAHPIEEKVKAEYKADEHRKYDQKINRTNAISTTQEILIATFIRRQFEKAMQAFDEIVEKTREIIRPGRSEPRNKKTKRLHYMNYKVSVSAIPSFPHRFQVLPLSAQINKLMEASGRYSKAIKKYQEVIEKTPITLSSFCQSHHINHRGLKQWMSRNNLTVRGLKSVVCSVDERAMVYDTPQQVFPLSFSGSKESVFPEKKSTFSLLKGVTVTFPDGVIVSIKEISRRDLSDFINVYTIP
jgi:tetratricopeptide (TPR) repeat protein